MHGRADAKIGSWCWIDARSACGACGQRQAVLVCCHCLAAAHKAAAAVCRSPWPASLSSSVASVHPPACDGMLYTPAYIACPHASTLPSQSRLPASPANGAPPVPCLQHDSRCLPPAPVLLASVPCVVVALPLLHAYNVLFCVPQVPPSAHTCWSDRAWSMLMTQNATTMCSTRCVLAAW